MALIAKELRFPLSFFSGDPIDEITGDNASFRALSAMSAAQRDVAFAAGAIAIEVGKVIGARVQTPACNIPELRWEDPIGAAEALREHWKMGTRPIKNMIHLLEFQGVRVFSLENECTAIDAFSLWRDDIPYVFVNRAKSGERGRFDVAHELGHLVLHRRGVQRGRDSERDADRFASTFLMPRESVLPHANHIPRGAPPLDSLMQLKSTWKVSAAALARRLKDLGILSQWQYQNVCVDLSSRGFRTAPEPNGIDQESSQLLPKVFAVLKERGISLSDLANQIGVLPSDLSALTFGYVLLPADGSAPREQAKKARPTLRLV
jgi:Zn-dependent peptidase ImmA (M78 family)